MMSSTSLTERADLMRRLDELPISSHDREIAKAQAGLAFCVVDTLFDALDDARGAFAKLRRGAPRARHARS
jgi:hypothetical protein